MTTNKKRTGAPNHVLCAAHAREEGHGRDVDVVRDTRVAGRVLVRARFRNARDGHVAADDDDRVRERTLVLVPHAEFVPRRAVLACGHGHVKVADVAAAGELALDVADDTSDGDDVRHDGRSVFRTGLSAFGVRKRRRGTHKAVGRWCCDGGWC